MSRNVLRLAAFDVLAPLATVMSMVALGVILGWPTWWVVACTAGCLLVAEGVAVNAYLARRDAVTVGTDDEGPGLRTGVVALATAAAVAVAVVGYRHWTVPDRHENADRAAVVDVVATVAEAVSTFTPDDPDMVLHKATEHMTSAQAQSFTDNFARATADLRAKRISQKGEPVSVGLEAIGPESAIAAALIRRTNVAGLAAPVQTVMAVRFALTKQDGRWLVDDIAPIDRVGAASPSTSPN